MRFKKAFTLAEALIVFIIIGIVASLGIVTVKPWEKSYKYAYSRMYNAISIAIYNHMITSADEAAFPATGNKLCEAFLKYINTSNDAESTTACTGSNLGINPKTFPDDKVKIKASNGTRIWIGADKGDVPFSMTQTIEAGLNDTVKFYMVYVDINGEKGPNTGEWKLNRMADIVAFVLTDKFKVIPIGYPEVDTRYLVSHVVYPSLNTDFSDATTDSRYTGDEEVTSDAMSYYEAKKNAYGDYVFSGVIDTYDFRGELPSDSYFRVEDYDDHYETVPTFDTASCELDTTGALKEPICLVKIYDYH